MRMPLCRQVIQGWMDIYAFRLENEISTSGTVIAQQWQLRKPAELKSQQEGPTDFLMVWSKWSGMYLFYRDVLLLKDRYPSCLGTGNPSSAIILRALVVGQGPDRSL